MKKIALFTFLLLTVALVRAQNIPNPSFEDWRTYTDGEIPESWNTSDSLIYSFLNSHTAEKEISDHCHLSYAIKLTSRGSFPLAVPGVATNGVIGGSLTAPTYSGGSPDTARSKYLNGCIKYNPTSGTDKAVISAFLFRWNSGAGRRDTVGYAIDSIGSTPSMTTFNQEFTYLDFDNQPDTIFIILQSSIGVFNASIGSSLVVDNLSLSGWVGIQEAGSPVKSMKLFPTPADRVLMVSAELSKLVTMHYEILDNNGKLAATAEMKSGTAQIDISMLAAGNYFFSLRDESGNSLASEQFTIAR